MFSTISGTVSQIFTPRNIPNLIYWFDFGQTSTITELSGSVSQVDDLSYNDNHATQGTAADQPTTGTLTLNGRNILDFDLDFLSVPAAVNIRANAGSVMTVSASDTLDSSFRVSISEWDSTSTARQFVSGQSNSNSFYCAFGPSTNINSIVSSSSAKKNLSVTPGYNQTSSFYINNALVSTVTSAVEVNSANAVIGGTQNGATWKGSIAEIFGARHEMSSVQRVKIERYGSAKWGV